MGQKDRYRLLDLECVLELLGQPDFRSFRAEYQDRIQSAIAENGLKRQKCWTESIAVGSKDYLKKIVGLIRSERLKTHIEETEDGSWAVFESPSDYAAPSA